MIDAADLKTRLLESELKALDALQRYHRILFRAKHIEKRRDPLNRDKFSTNATFSSSRL